MTDLTTQARMSVDTSPGDDAVFVPVERRGSAWRRFRQNRLAVIGLVILTVLILAAIFAPLITFYSPDDPTSLRRAGPSTAHWFGTDRLGQDIYTRIVFGARISLKIAVVATLMAMVIGVLLGSLAGYAGGPADTLIMRLTDVFLGIPYIILAIVIAVRMGRSENTVIIVLGATGWLAVCRIVRSMYLQMKKQEYVEAARALGFGPARIMFRHILPNAVQPIIVYATLAVGGAILSEAALSFLGVGPPDGTPAWGLMVSDNKGELQVAPHLLFIPGGAIVLTVLAFMFVGDGLRDALDPRLKQ